MVSVEPDLLNNNREKTCELKQGLRAKNRIKKSAHQMILSAIPY